MSWYKCPRCGGTDSFQGTELVTHVDKGSASTVHTEYGSFTQNTSGQSRTDEVTVSKCRGCGELLSAKDYQYTQEELEAIKLREAEAKKFPCRWWHYAILGYLISVLIGLIVWMAFRF
jgi:hypothetical protein